MNVDVLSNLLKDIFNYQDEVTLPGFGSFVAEEVPASFSDKGYTINPPYRRLAYRPHQGDDTFLIDAYAKSKNIATMSAQSELEAFFTDMRTTLKAKKLIILPGLGKLRATKENHFFFVCDEDLNIFPEGFGLEPISLKSRSSHKSASQGVPQRQQLIDENAPAQQKEKVSDESRSESKEPKKAAVVPEKAQENSKKMPAAVKLLITVVILLAVAVAFLFVLKYFAPDLLYKLLYSQDELEIINYILK